MSDTNRVAIRATKNASPGTIPNNPVMQTICHTGTTLAYQKQTVQSEKICGGTSRGVKDLILVGVDAGEGFTGELEFRATDFFFEGLFQNTWSQKPYRSNREGATNITSVNTTTFTVVDGSGAGHTFAEGDIIRTSGFTNAANNRVFVAAAGTNDTSIITTGLVAETPPTTAELRKVGVQASSGDVAATVTSGNALTSSSLDFETLGLTPGQWIKIGGSASANQFATAALNTYVRVSAVSANRLDLDVVPSGWAADNGSGRSIRIFFGDFLKDAATKVDYTIEQEFGDHSPATYQYFEGMFPDSFSFEGAQRSIVNYTYSFLGLDAGEPTSSRVAGASTMAMYGNESMQTSSNVGRIAEGGMRMGSPNYVTNVSLQINNNGRRRTAWGELGTVGVGSGDFNVTGTVTTYFGDPTLLAKVVGHTESSLDFAFQDSEDHALVFDIPRVKYPSGVPNVPGRNQDVTLPLEFQGLEDETLGYTMSVTRFHAMSDDNDWT